MIKRLWPGALEVEPGVFVVYDPRVLAIKVGPWVMLGFEFMTKLTPLEIQAVVAHERGHNWWHGFLKNVVSAFAPAFLPSITRRQELLADDYAKRQGLGLALASALLKFEHLQQKDYPPIQERVRRLRDGVTTQR